jgi:DHA1 family tetracycline resistance protein-like MFS transporter
VLLAVFAAMFAFAGMETTFALLGARRFGLGPSGLGLVFAGVGVAMVVVQAGLVGRVTDRYGDAAVAVGGAVLLAVGLLALPFVPAWIGYPALALLAIGQGLLSTTTATLVARLGRRELGGAFGLNQSASAAARTVGPLIAGAAFDLRAALPYVGGAALCAIAAALLALTATEVGDATGEVPLLDKTAHRGGA